MCVCMRVHACTGQDDGIATTFGKKRQALEALNTGVVLADLSHWGRVRVSGDDRASFMHNQSTADFKALQPGQGIDTVSGSGAAALARCGLAGTH